LPQPKQHHKTKPNKTKQLGWCGILIGKKTTTPPPPYNQTMDVITF
jgi:hypothetical protein